MSVRSEGLGAWVLDRVGPTLRARPRRGEAPEVDVRTGATVPAAAVRGALAIAGVLLAVVAATAPGSVAPVAVLVLMLAAGVAPALLPRWPLTSVLLLVVAVRLLFADLAPPLVLAALVLLVHVVLRLAPVAARTGWRARVEVAVLAGDARGALVVQAAAQVLALLAGLAAGAGAAGQWHAVGAVAVVALTTLVLARPARSWWRSD